MKTDSSRPPPTQIHIHGVPRSYGSDRCDYEYLLWPLHLGTCSVNTNQTETSSIFNSGNSTVDHLLTTDSLGGHFYLKQSSRRLLQRTTQPRLLGARRRPVLMEPATRSIPALLGKWSPPGPHHLSGDALGRLTSIWTPWWKCDIHLQPK